MSRPEQIRIGAYAAPERDDLLGIAISTTPHPTLPTMRALECPWRIRDWMDRRDAHRAWLRAALISRDHSTQTTAPFDQVIAGIDAEWEAPLPPDLFQREAANDLSLLLLALQHGVVIELRNLERDPDFSPAILVRDLLISVQD